MVPVETDELRSELYRQIANAYDGTYRQYWGDALTNVIHQNMRGALSFRLDWLNATQKMLVLMFMPSRFVGSFQCFNDNQSLGQVQNSFLRYLLSFEPTSE